MKLPWWMILDWRSRKIPLILCAIEFPFTVATLTLFGIADPNTYRTALWKEGAIHGWNSDPIEILYSYANYRPIAAPTPWNQFITDFNIVIIILSMFFLLGKTVMYITHTLPPFFSTIVHGIFMVLYAYSISQQAGSDYIDKDHPSKVPWFLTRSCGEPITPKLQGFCKQAQASFAMTVLMCVLFFVYFVASLVSAIPNATQRAENAHKEPDIESPVSYYDDKKWDFELSRLPNTPGSPSFPKTPMTPRTVAFQTLDGTMGGRKPNKDLPLRQHIAM